MRVWASFVPLSLLLKLGSAVSVRQGYSAQGINQAGSSSSPTKAPLPSALMKSEVSNPLLAHNEASSSTRRSKVETKRRERVEQCRRRFQDLQANVLNKDRTTLTIDEQQQISLLRLQLSAQMSDYKQSKAPYLDSLIAELDDIRRALPLKSQFRDEETKKQIRKQQLIDLKRRFRTREKARKHGVNITVKMGRRPLKDNAPEEIVSRRNRAVRHLRKVKGRLGGDEDTKRSNERHSDKSERASLEDVLTKGWGMRRQRSYI